MSLNWIRYAGYVLLGYFLFIITVVAVHQLRKIRDEGDSGVADIPWLILKRQGLSHKQYQYGTIFIIVLGYFSIVYFATTENTEPVIIGSLLGALPVLLFELNREVRKPHVVLDEVSVVEYPEEWWSFGLKRTHKQANNAIGIHARFRNDGRETAENCTVRVISDSVSGQQYHTRWSNQNQLTLELSPKEEQTADLLWIDLETQIVQTGNPNVKSTEDHDPPGSYKKTSRPEMSTNIHSLRVVVSADNMSETTFPVNIGDKSRVRMPSDIINAATEWNVISALKKNSNGTSVIKYHRKTTKTLEVPDTLTDLEYLRRIDEFNKENIQSQLAEEYESALKRKYELKRF